MTDRIFSASPTDEGYWDALDTVKEVFDVLEKNGTLTAGRSFSTGLKVWPKPSDYIMDADEILEHYDCQINDNEGEYADGCTGSDGVTDEAKAELNALLKQWANKNMEISFYRVEKDESIVISQAMINAYHAWQPIPMPKLKFEFGAPSDE